MAGQAGNARPRERNNMEETQPKPFVFVLMPFAKELDDLYQLGIKACCTEAGAYCERVDETFFEEGIVSRIYNQISKADIVVAEMTGRSPNVFYEVGYAHALGKRVILLTATAQDIPFDLTQYSHIVHGGRIVDLKAELKKRIEWCMAHPARSLAQAEVQVQLFCGGQEMTSDYVRQSPVTSFLPLDLALHNPTHRAYPAGSLLVGLVTHRLFDCCYSADTTGAREGARAQSMKLPDGRMLHLLTWFCETVFPSGWAHIPCQANALPGPEPDEVYDFAVRLFTELGARDLPFRVKFTSGTPAG
jgi:hypothetical protein